MSCCTANGTARYFDRRTRKYAKTFRRKGLDRQQTMLLGALRGAGIEGSTVLEIGCGVGGLHLALLAAGASGATGMDLSAAMIAQAEENAAEFGMGGKTQYIRGDFVDLAAGLPDADIVLLDKVVCCYAKPELLLERSLGKTRGMYAISYPRSSLAARVFFRTADVAGEWLRWAFHPYYHDPERIRGVIMASGMREVWSGTTPMWAVEVFARQAA